ncbi:MAG: hypothetical protein LLG06_10625 [Desulfobacteraceae bacterium]|nr:hypothetical protein [Desulfobacteraceae bacterium]
MRTILAVLLFLVFAGAGFCDEASSPNGIFINKQDSKQYISFHPDGTFFLKQRSKPFDPYRPFIEVSGKYSVAGEEVTLNISGGGEATGKWKTHTFTDSDGSEWVKEGTITPPERAKRPPKWW